MATRCPSETDKELPEAGRQSEPRAGCPGDDGQRCPRGGAPPDPAGGVLWGLRALGTSVRPSHLTRVPRGFTHHPDSRRVTRPGEGREVAKRAVVRSGLRVRAVRGSFHHACCERGDSGHGEGAAPGGEGGTHRHRPNGGQGGRASAGSRVGAWRPGTKGRFCLQLRGKAR